jgi:sugar phosphate permease
MMPPGPVIQSFIGSLIATALVGAFWNTSSWKDVAIVFLVFAFIFYVGLSKSARSE